MVSSQVELIEEKDNGAKQSEDLVIHSSRKRVRISAKHGDSALDEVNQCKMIIIIQ